MSDGLKAAVIGASGIGKHHAKWLQALGCEVSFAGTSQEKVDATQRALQEQFGFNGRGYVGVEALLDSAQPDLVVVASPAQVHFPHFMAAIERGCHVLCEKPLVWDETRPIPDLLAEARQMVGAAEDAGVVAGVNTQYVTAVEPYFALCEQAGRPADPTGFARFWMRMDSRGGKAGAGGEKIWIDLAPHPISVLVAFAGPGRVKPGSERCRVQERRVDAQFTYLRDRGGEVQACIETVNVPEGPLSRSLGIDGVVVDYEGRNDECGVYAAYLKLGDVEFKATDFMQASISRFVEAVRGHAGPAADMRSGLANLELQLGLLEASRQ